MRGNFLEEQLTKEWLRKGRFIEENNCLGADRWGVEWQQMCCFERTKLLKSKAYREQELYFSTSLWRT